MLPIGREIKESMGRLKVKCLSLEANYVWLLQEHDPYWVLKIIIVYLVKQVLPSKAGQLCLMLIKIVVIFSFFLGYMLIICIVLIISVTGDSFVSLSYIIGGILKDKCVTRMLVHDSCVEFKNSKPVGLAQKSTYNQFFKSLLFISPMLLEKSMYFIQAYLLRIFHHPTQLRSRNYALLCHLKLAPLM